MLTMAAAVLALILTPRVCLSPCVVKVTIQVADARTDDQMRVEFDGSEYHASDVIVVKGQRTYILPPIVLRGAGPYEVRVMLLRGEDETYSVQQTIDVRGE